MGPLKYWTIVIASETPWQEGKDFSAYCKSSKNSLNSKSLAEWPHHKEQDMCDY